MSLICFFTCACFLTLHHKFACSWIARDTLNAHCPTRATCLHHCWIGVNYRACSAAISNASDLRSKHALPSSWTTVLYMQCSIIASCLVLFVCIPVLWLKLNVTFEYMISKLTIEKKKKETCRKHVQQLPILTKILNRIQATCSIQWKLCPLSLVDILMPLTLQSPSTILHLCMFYSLAH